MDKITARTPWEPWMGSVPMHLDYFQGTMFEAVEMIAVKDIKADAYGIESPRGNSVKMFLNGATVIVVGRHHLERVAHTTDEGLVVEHLGKPFFSIEDKVPVLKSYIAFGYRRQ